MKFFTQNRFSSQPLLGLVFVLFLIIAKGSSLNAQVILNTETLPSEQENQVVVAVTVKNFENIASMQFSTNWNPDFLEFLSIDSLSLQDLTIANFNTRFAENGEIALAWFNQRALGNTVADGTTLFTITFLKLSEVPTDIFFDDTPTQIEFATPGQVISVTSESNEIITSGYLLKGKVLFDTNDNCVPDGEEKGLSDWLIEIRSDKVKRYKTSNVQGDFQAYLPFGEYEVTAIPPTNNYFSICEPVQTISILETASEPVNIVFAGQAELECPSMNVQIGTPFLRRCFENGYSVSYNNNGTVAAEGVYVLVELDPFLDYLSSGIPGQLISDNTYRFDIGTVGVSESGTFDIKVKVNCERTELGQTHCVKARIFPDIICEAVSENWSGAELELESDCIDNQVQFRIKNVGDGDMLDKQKFIVIEDMILLRNEQENEIQLKIGESQIVDLPANGATYRLETQQVPFHPIEVPLAAAIEGCGTDAAGEFSKGIITMFRSADDSQFVDEDCEQNRGAFDPNDKNASPAGYNTAHFLEPNSDIDYHIRFQNTGTDTAFNIVVLDTLSDLLDVSTITQLGSSHPYEFEVVDSNILKYSFNNIMLPDSNINEPASHGYFKFNIQQKPDVELGSLIENSAAIFFDFNEPIITNTYFHTVGFDYIEVRVITSTREFFPIDLSISPNPFKQFAKVQIGKQHFSSGQFSLFDLTGREVQSYKFSGNQFDIERGDLTPGLYVFEIRVAGELQGLGKLVIE